MAPPTERSTILCVSSQNNQLPSRPILSTTWKSSCYSTIIAGRICHTSYLSRLSPESLGGQRRQVHGRRPQPAGVDGQVILQGVGPVGAEVAFAEALPL